MRHSLRFVSLICLVALTAHESLAQVPIPYSEARPISEMNPGLRSTLQAKAGPYPLVGFQFGRDSALLVFEDPAMTADAVLARKWMFGPPVTAAEADSCPPEKVLGRRIARLLFKELGRPESIVHIVVAVRGVAGRDRWTAEGMNYWRKQLIDRWAGDPDAP